VITRLWLALNRRRWHRFQAALDRPGEAQRQVLASILQRNTECAFGRRHGFSGIDSIEQFRNRVPLSEYEDYTDAIERIRSGDRGVLTTEPVTRLTPTSGSSGAVKLIPWTRSLQSQFNNGIGPWVCDLYGRRPELKGGPAYWSISPAARVSAATGSAVSVGFDDDTQYLGGWLSRLVSQTMAVPSDVRLIEDMATLRYVTLRLLLAERGLRLISVWHPSFLALMLDFLTEHREQLARDCRDGTLTPPGDVPPAVRRTIAARIRRRVDVDWDATWPNLTVVSCWADGAAGSPAKDLRRRLGSVEIQPKGLVSTEAFVSLPFGDAHPLSIRSHFFEFIDVAGECRLVDELEMGGTYSVVVTSGGGLYRYRLHDTIVVDGFVGRTPSIRFVARDNNTSDFCGEKLAEPFVVGVLRDVVTVDHRFAMLAIDTTSMPPGYVLFIEADGALSRQLGAAVDEALCENFHYQYCRDLGQLQCVRVFRIDGDAAEAYLRHVGRPTSAAGQIKPVSLHGGTDWASVFKGRMVKAGSDTIR